MYPLSTRAASSPSADRARTARTKGSRRPDSNRGPLHYEGCLGLSAGIGARDVCLERAPIRGHGAGRGIGLYVLARWGVQWGIRAFGRRLKGTRRFPGQRSRVRDPSSARENPLPSGFSPFCDGPTEPPRRTSPCPPLCGRRRAARRGLRREVGCTIRSRRCRATEVANGSGARLTARGVSPGST
jgi:hypothetical protein